MSIYCHPFHPSNDGVDTMNCCDGGALGEACNADVDCLGNSYCAKGTKVCVGESMCSWKCNQYAAGKILACCVRETSTCRADSDCVGLRSCRDGKCYGTSGCEKVSLVREVIHVDESCQCQKGQICKTLDDSTCSADCYHTKESPGKYTCLGEIPHERQIIYEIGCQCDAAMKTCNFLDGVSFSSECYAWREAGSGNLHCTLKG
jgi:hypothetical protein